jgi:hypothetical protein
MTRSAYMASSAPLLPDKCFRWAPCPPWLCKCTDSTEYKNNANGVWRGACLSANSPQLINTDYKVTIATKKDSGWWSQAPETLYCCSGNDPSNHLLTTLNLTDMICSYIEIDNKWYDISGDYKLHFKAEISNNTPVLDPSYFEFLKHYSDTSVNLVMSCNGITTEPSTFCSSYAGAISPGPAPTIAPTPAPTPLTKCISYTVKANDGCWDLAYKHGTKMKYITHSDGSTCATSTELHTGEILCICPINTPSSECPPAFPNIYS